MPNVVCTWPCNAQLSFLPMLHDFRFSLEELDQSGRKLAPNQCHLCSNLYSVKAIALNLVRHDLDGKPARSGAWGVSNGLDKDYVELAHPGAHAISSKAKRFVFEVPSNGKFEPKSCQISIIFS